jgi:hypothetical protein
MKRLPRVSLTLAIACSFTFPVALFAQQQQGGQPQQQPAGAGGAAATQQQQPVDDALRRDVEDFWHYAKIARYDLANAQAQKILQRKDNPAGVLQAFEQVSRDRNDDLDQWLLRWQGVDALRDSVTQIIGVLNEARFGRRNDISYIEDSIRRLSVNERAYALAIQRLRESGELAIPIMIDYLRDPSKKEYFSGIRRALRDLGREALNPLLAATQMNDPATLVTIIDALGDIGYDVTVPYLLRLTQDQKTPDAVRRAAADALTRMGVDPKSQNAAEAFYNIGEKFYYNTTAIQTDTRRPVAYLWYWNDQQGLSKKDVPTPIFHDLMAMRSSEYALRLAPEMGQALSLWLAANYNREVELPQGAKDPTRGENQPDAHYYGVAAGAQYVNAVLARALNDHNSPVALKSVKSLQEILGASNLFSGGQGQPIVDALNYADRTVRYEAAFAIAQALPQKEFPGQERVVPILAEALSQSGKPNVLVIVPSQDDVNRIAEAFKGQYTLAGASNVDAAVNEASRLSSIDVIVVSDQLPAGEVERLFDMSRRVPQLANAAKLIVTQTRASRYASLAINNPMVTLTQVRQPADLKGPIEQARKRAGALAMEEKASTDYAMRAADLLGKLAISRGQVLDLSVAEPALISQLDDTRPELVIAVGKVLALLNSPNAQNALLSKAVDEKTTDDVKVSLYNSLATSAKFFGNHLTAESIATLQKVVESAPNLKVRSAAAEVRGALNLPADEARTLILQQAKV